MRKTIFFIIIIIFFANHLYASEGCVAKNPKSVLAGMNWSIYSTAIPVGTGLVLMGVDGAFGWVTLGGIILGPSTGHFYAHQWTRGLAGIGARSVITGGLLVVALGAGQRENWGALGATAWLWLGSMVLVSTIDIVTVPNSVKRHNAHLEEMQKLDFIPYLDVKNKKYGLSLQYHF